MLNPPLFSLVVGTKGRSTELARLLESLAMQTCRDFEIFIIDQNADDRVRILVAKVGSTLPISHHQVSFSGLSRARNFVLSKTRGRFIAFPDDDCWYPPRTLEAVAAMLDDHPDVDGLCGRSETPEGRASHVRAAWRARDLNRYNVWSLAISYTIFLRCEVVREVGEFDEALGVGSGTPWGSGEETDYLLRALALGYRLRHDPGVVVWHPALPDAHTPQTWSRGLLYGAGLGRVLRKNGAPTWFAMMMLLRASLGVCFGLAVLRPGVARFHLNVLRGRWSGWHAVSDANRET
jgi:glycosyltransferase involved in cell wall biosynthesis